MSATNNLLTFYINGNPIGKERPRKGKYGNFYTPSKTKEFEKLVTTELILNEKARCLPITKRSPRIKLDIYCQFNSKRHPDLDNIWKAIADSIARFYGINDKNFYGSFNFGYGKEVFTKVTLYTNRP